jgi:hypothetical protein
LNLYFIDVSHKHTHTTAYYISPQSTHSLYITSPAPSLIAIPLCSLPLFFAGRAEANYFSRRFSWCFSWRFSWCFSHRFSHRFWGTASLHGESHGRSYLNGCAYRPGYNFHSLSQQLVPTLRCDHRLFTVCWFRHVLRKHPTTRCIQCCSLHSGSQRCD